MKTKILLKFLIYVKIIEHFPEKFIFQRIQINFYFLILIDRMHQDEAYTLSVNKYKCYLFCSIQDNIKLKKTSNNNNKKT